MTTKMTLESENMEEVVEKVKKIVNEVEPDVNMVKA
jgi:zinc-transporting ATPase